MSQEEYEEEILDVIKRTHRYAIPPMDLSLAEGIIEIGRIYHSIEDNRIRAKFFYLYEVTMRQDYTFGQAIKHIKALINENQLVRLVV